MQTSSFLKSTMFNQIKMYIKDYLKNYLSNDDLQNKETQKLFDNFEIYKACLEIMFSNIEQEQIVERVLFQLKQQGLVTQYQAKFQQYIAQTNQNKVVLKVQFYYKLKDIVKNKLSRIEQLETLAKLIEIAIKIDNRNYKQTLEQKGQYKFRTYIAKTRNKNKEKKPQATSYQLQLIELDTFQRKEQVSKEGMDY